jgi:hypothetical protein
VRRWLIRRFGDECRDSDRFGSSSTDGKVVTSFGGGMHHLAALFGDPTARLA